MNKKEVGNKIRKLRIKNGISTYLLRQEGWCSNTITNIEKAKSNYTIDNILKLCDRIGAEINIQEKEK
ncbi:MAG: helix-turn-helix domain-containing protein [Bacteroidales bacterium]|jgi:transcriptional regulator with XRE-family HTH domain|nr:helix-turn-helix domain-containing protein [Bacteroidales bacterium]